MLIIKIINVVTSSTIIRHTVVQYCFICSSLQWNTNIILLYWYKRVEQQSLQDCVTTKIIKGGNKTELHPEELVWWMVYIIYYYVHRVSSSGWGCCWRSLIICLACSSSLLNVATCSDSSITNWELWWLKTTREEDLAVVASGDCSRCSLWHKRTCSKESKN